MVGGVSLYVAESIMKGLGRKIRIAQDFCADRILRMMMERQNRLYPGYEMVILSLPRFDEKERVRQLEMMTEILRKRDERK